MLPLQNPKVLSPCKLDEFDINLTYSPLIPFLFAKDVQISLGPFLICIDTRSNYLKKTRKHLA